jgi:hypothetical protein
MTHKERMLAAIHHTAPDRVPRGRPEEVAEQATWLCENIGKDGGHILSTCNTLIDAIPVANARAMYGAGIA